MKNTVTLLYFVAILNVFYLTPLSVFADIFILLISILGVYYFRAYNMFKVKLYSRFFLLISVLFIISIVASYLAYHQDLISGLIASQKIFKAYSIFVIIQWHKQEKLNFNKIIDKLIILCGFYTIFIAYASVTEFSFVRESALSSDELVVTANKYSKDLLLFGEFFFLAKYFRSGKLINLLYVSIIFAVTQIYDIQRGDIIFFAATLFIAIFLYGNKKLIVRLLLIMPAAIITFFVFLGSSELMTTLTSKFSQLFMLFGSSQELSAISDASIFVRLQELEFALKGFIENPIFGNGLFRSSIKEELFGDLYFFPADVGIVGVLYCYGIIGGLLFCYLVYLLFKERIGNLNQNSVTLYLYLVFSVFNSVKDGSLILKPTQFLFLFLVMILLKKEKIPLPKNKPSINPNLIDIK